MDNGLTQEKCSVYLDDVLVVGRTAHEHLTNLRSVFNSYRQLDWSWRQQSEYAGFNLEILFLWLYGRDPGLPTETLAAPVPCTEVNIVTYKEEMVQYLAKA